MSSIRILSKLIRLVSSMTGWMILAILLGTLGFLATAAIPVLAGLAIVQILRGSAQNLSILFAAMGGCAIARGFLRYGEQACNHYIAFKLLAQIRDRIFSKLRSLPLTRLDGKNKGDLIALLTSDVELLEVFYAHTVSPVSIAVLCAILFSVAGMMIHPLVSLVLMASYFVSGILIPLAIGARARKSGMDLRHQSGKLTGFVLENVTGIRENLQYGQAEAKLQEMEQRTDELAVPEEKLKTEQAKASSFMQYAVTGSGLLMIAVCLYLAGQGEISSLMVIPALILQESTFGPFAALANLGTGLAPTLGAGARVLELLEEEAETKIIEEGVQANGQSFELENVSFGYDKTEKPVLDSFSFEIPKGTLLGISGPSGCGKSTLLKMLMRFFDPDSGTVSLGSDHLNTIRTRSLLENEAMMSQDTFLFEGSVRDNLRIACPDASDEELKAACRHAAIDGLIDSFEEGYDTLIAGKSRSLSAGERQRIGLARAFLSRRPILLLDEPTSNMDALSEGAIMKSVSEHAKEKTTIIVSHKKGTLGFADAMLQMNQAGIG